MIKKILRRILGRMVFGNILKLINFLTLPKPIKRNSEAQKLINLQTDKVALYQFGTCPFCIKVTRFIHQNSLNIELRNTRKDPDHKTDLVNLGESTKYRALELLKRMKKISGFMSLMKLFLILRS